MLNPLDKFSRIINKGLFGKDNPLCYTAYEAKGFWYVLFNCIFFWEQNHCRKVYLEYKIHERIANENK